MSNLVAGLVIAQKYKLTRLLAKGGMGSVWAANNFRLKMPVAIKFMAPSTVGSPELVARFEREATAAAQLRSPQVVQVFEHGVDRGAPFIVMELLEGEDLNVRLKREERLSIESTARIVSEVCKALRRAQEMGIVHRDLKPANIFLARNDEDESVKVLDFGVAKLLAEANEWKTRAGQLVGTAPYMSPEQVQCSGALDHRSDLWSLGVIAFRALTGRLPFDSEAMVDIMVRIFTEAAPRPSSIAPELGPGVDRFFARALATDPEARFQSAREMAEAMNALAGRTSLADAGAPASARPDGCAGLKRHVERGASGGTSADENTVYTQGNLAPEVTVVPPPPALPRFATPALPPASPSFAPPPSPPASPPFATRSSPPASPPFATPPSPPGASPGVASPSSPGPLVAPAMAAAVVSATVPVARVPAGAAGDLGWVVWVAAAAGLLVIVVVLITAWTGGL